MTVLKPVDEPVELADFSKYVIGSPIVRLSDGSYVATYFSLSDLALNGADVFVQRFDSAGKMVGAPILANTTTAGAQMGDTFTQVTALKGGGFVVSWFDRSGVSKGDSDGDAVKAQVFNNAGQKVGGEIQVNTVTAEDQNAPSMISLANGGFVIAWTDASPGYLGVAGPDLKFQVFAANGSPLGPERLLNYELASDETQDEVALAALEGGGFVASYTDDSHYIDGEGTGVSVRRFDDTGNPLSAYTLANDSHVGSDHQSTVKGLPGGGFVVAWVRDPTQPRDYADTDIWFRVFDKQGAPLAMEQLASDPGSTRDLSLPQIIVLADGRFILSWTDQNKTPGAETVTTVLRLFDAEGTPLTQEVEVSPDLLQLAAMGAVTPDGDVLLTYLETSGLIGGNTAADFSAFIQRWGVFEEMAGTAGADNPLFGTAGRDLITALGGADVVFGGAHGDWIEGQEGGDTLSGDGGNDILLGGQQSDVLYGGDGNDRLDASGNNGVAIADSGDDLFGGAGIDTASYRTAVAGVVASLAAPGTNTNEASGDLYSSIENLDGSGHDDTLTGNAASNVLSGRGGEDSLVGGAGADTLDGGADGDDLVGGVGADRLYGGAGFDFAYYSGTAGITVDLAAPGGNTGEAAGDSYRSIEGLSGTGSADVLRGDAAANTLRGGLGNDVLEGRGGADGLQGGDGRDTVSFSRSATGVTVDFTAPVNNTGDAVGDIYESIENLNGSNFADVLRANAENNTLNGFDGDDRLVAREGSDTLYGWTGSDVLEGNQGIDTLFGGASGDTLLGGDANDVLNGGASGDLMYGGGGFDRVSYEGAAAGVTASLLSPGSNTGDAAGDVYSSVEHMTGSGFADTLQGDGALNRISGGNGNDIIGGRGGNDILTGGLGADRFLFDTAPNGASNMDTITDYNVAADTIRLDQTVYSELALGTLAPGAFRNGTAAADADDRIIYDAATGSIWYDPDGNKVGGLAQVKFADVANGLALTNADFFVVA